MSSGKVAGSVDFHDVIPEHFKNYFGKSDDKMRYIEMRIIIKLAGSCAHDEFHPMRTRDAGDDYDEKWAMAIIEDRASWAENDRAEYLENCRNKAKKIVQTNWDWISDVAHELTGKKTLTGVDILELRR